MTDTQQQQNPALPAEEKEKRVGSGAGRASGRLPGLEDLAARKHIPTRDLTIISSPAPPPLFLFQNTNKNTREISPTPPLPHLQNEHNTSNQYNVWIIPTSSSHLAPTHQQRNRNSSRRTGGSGTGPPSASSDKPTESQIPLPAVSISVSDPNGEEVKPSQPMPRGYKNVPSLDAIAGRLKAQKEKEKEQQEPSGKSGDESGSGAVELEQGEIEEVKGEVDTTSSTRTTGESPVPYTPSNTETGEYEAGLKVVGKFRTVEDFCRLFNWLKPPSKLERSSNYHMFKEDIKPMWEDPANANGGKWVITMRNNPVLLDRCWSWLAMGLVGQELDDREDMICGAVVSLRSRIDRIQLWIRQKDDVERVNAIGKKLVKLLDLDREPGIQLEFQTGCVAGVRFWTIWKAVMEFWFGGVLPVWMPVQSVGAEGEKGKERKEGTEKLKIHLQVHLDHAAQPSFRRGPDTPGSEQGPSYFGRGGGAFGAFGRGGGAFGGAGRGKGDWGAPKSAVEGSAPFGANAGAGHARSSSASGTGDK
ncbi:Eukaryotic initiation factor 4E [Rhizoctonia solani]|uniref:Eukaryotic initiation factor 4E n=1 Tax=Rhizoctonia solani TaxID=456999 RepID=A0A8H7IDV2_9AGAM|nr:Eukaryotic initiation factor 4E [Rhizoctonia solani]